MTLPSALHPRALHDPCAGCGGKMYTCFATKGDTRPYSLRSGVKVMRNLCMYSYCENCQAIATGKVVMTRKERNDPPVDEKVVQVLKMLKRGGWDPWKRIPTQLSEV